METYPRTVVLENPKLKLLLQEKTDLILAGREISMEIEDKEKEMQAADEAIQKIERSVDVGDLKVEATELTQKMNALAKEMKVLQDKLKEKLKAGVSPDAIKVYEDAKLTKEELEMKRNKIALKVQQINDKAIPLGRKLMKPHLEDKFDDFDSLRIENDEVIGTIFNHKVDFERAFAEKVKK